MFFKSGRKFFRSIYAGRLIFGHYHPYLHSVGQPPQLFEPFCPLQSRFRQRNETPEDITAESIRSDVKEIINSGRPFRQSRITVIREDRTAEIKGIAAHIRHHLGIIRRDKSPDAFRGVKMAGKCGYIDRRVIEHRRKALKVIGIYERLIALDIDHHLRRYAQYLQGPATSCSPAVNIAVSKHGSTPAGADRHSNTLVISGHNNVSGAQRLMSPAIDTPHHRLPAHIGERLPREPARSPPRRDYTQNISIGHLFNFRQR